MIQFECPRFDFLVLLLSGALGCAVLVGCGATPQDTEPSSSQVAPVAESDASVPEVTPGSVADTSLTAQARQLEMPLEHGNAAEDTPVQSEDAAQADQASPVEQNDAPPAAMESAGAEDPQLVKLSGVARFQQLGAEIEMGAENRVIGVDLKETQVTDADLIHLADLEDLKSLNLSRTAVTDAGLQQVANLRRLKFLYLYGADITDEGVKRLAELDRLEILCLDDTRITDKSLKLLGEMKRLEKLHVQTRATMTDDGLGYLAGLRRLFELRIPHSEISEDAVKALRVHLPRCKVLRPEVKPIADSEPTD